MIDETTSSPSDPARDGDERRSGDDRRHGERRAVRARSAPVQPALPDAGADELSADDRDAAAESRTDAAALRSTDAAVRSTDAAGRDDATADAADRAADALDRAADAADRSADSIDRFAAAANLAAGDASKSVSELRSAHSESVARTDELGESLADRAGGRAVELPAARVVDPERIAEHIDRVGRRFDSLTRAVVESSPEHGDASLDSGVVDDGAPAPARPATEDGPSEP